MKNRLATLAVGLCLVPACGDNVLALDAGHVDAAAAADAGLADGDASTFGAHAFWFAFHACNLKTTDCGDPQNHRVYLSTTNDFASFTLLPNWGMKGSVPDVVRRGNTVYVYVPGQVIRLRAGATTPDVAANVNVIDLSGGYVDPSLYVDGNGRLVMFFLKGGGPGSGNPAGCPQGQSSCTKQFQSATEVDGSDGTEFVLDTGDRINLTVSPGGPAGTFLTASDPDIFYDGKQYVIYTSHGQSLAVWTAAGLRDTYAQVKPTPTGYLTESGGIGAGYFDTKTSKYWTFVHVKEGGAPVIKRAIHDSLSATLAASVMSTILTGASSGLGADFGVESPSIAENK